ncbi:MAG: hypothetical protein U0795_24130 [Pirellulales bacterium]
MNRILIRHCGMVLFLGLVSVGAGDTVAMCQNKKPSFRLSDFPEHTEIIGSLEVPLGTIVDVVGVWQAPDSEISKDSSLRLHLKSIDGKPVPDRTTFSLECVRPVMATTKLPVPKAGQEWALRVVESARLEGFPAAVWQEFGETVQQKYGYTFVNELHYLTVRIDGVDAYRQKK